MRVLTTDEFKKEKFQLFEKIKDGAVFIYPTDTIYGIGCDAMLSNPVAKIRNLKSRQNNPFSVIAPSKEWIMENCIVSNEGEEWIGKLPGPYTFIFKTRKICTAKEVNISLKTIGVRMPAHWSSSLAAELKVPLVTTSVNKSGDDFMTSLEDIDADIEGNVDFIIYEGQLKGRPSKIVDLSGKPRIIVR